MANFGNLSSVSPLKAVREYVGESVDLRDETACGKKLRDGAMNIVRGESLRALAMVEYSRRVLKRVGADHADTLRNARVKDVSDAKLETDTDKVPGTSWSFGDYLDSNCRIAGLYLALRDGVLDIHKPDAGGLTLFASADLLRRDFTDSAGADPYKSARGRPKATDAEKAEKTAARDAEKAAKAALDAAAADALRAKAATADTFEGELNALRNLLRQVAAAAGYEGPADGLAAHVAGLAARPKPVAPVVRPAKPAKPVRPALENQATA
jgi:hypothetical protein